MNKNKYSAKKVKCDGMTFMSRMEHKRYEELKLLVKSGEIEGLICQPKFIAVVNGTKVCSIILDFQYYDKKIHTIIYEDVKGVDTPMSKLKRKLLKALYPETDLRILRAR